MSFFNEEQTKAISTGRYICNKCGAVMDFENKWEDTLICSECNHDVDLEHYGFENDEDYDALYPTYEEVMGCEEEDCDEDDDDGCNEYDNEDEYR